MPNTLGSSEVVAAVLAVLFGWVLGLLGSGARAFGNRRVAAARAFSKLYPLRAHLVILPRVLEDIFERSESPVDYERQRAGFLERHAKILMRTQTMSLDEEITALAGYWPMLAVEIRASLERLDKVLSLRHDATSQVSVVAYATFLSVGELGLELETKNFDKLLRRVAWRVSVPTYMAFRWRTRAARRRLAGGDSLRDMLGKTADDLLAQGRSAETKEAE